MKLNDADISSKSSLRIELPRVLSYQTPIFRMCSLTSPDDVPTASSIAPSKACSYSCPISSMGSRCLNIALLYILCQSGERFSDLKVLMFGSRAQKPPESIHLHVPPEIRRQVYSSTQIASARRYRGAFRISAIIAYCSTWLQSSSMPRWISPKGLLCQEPRALMKHSSLLTFQGMLPKRHLTFVESACKDIMMRF
jgi:hypothetical protein